MRCHSHLNIGGRCNFEELQSLKYAGILVLL